MAKEKDMGFGKRFPIKFPKWHTKRLLWWAHAKGVSKTGLTQNTMQARIEANEEQIERMMQDLAEEAGMKVKAYKAKVLEEMGYDPTDDDVDD